MKYLIKSILAGFCIAIGGTVFLSIDNKIIGSLLFSIGLFLIVTRELNLFTGKVGYIFNNKLSYLKEVLITLIGNFIGTFLVGNILRFTRIYSSINEYALKLTNVKLHDNLLSIFILSIMCGMLMLLAVDGYKKLKYDFGKYLCVIICVVVFILCGFEHSIANMYYFSVVGIWNIKVIKYILVMVLGNTCGGVIFPLAEKLIKKK